MHFLQTDVIVVCSSSQYLLDAICKAGGSQFKTSFDTESNKSIIAIKSSGQIASKMVYFLPCKPTSDTSLLQQSLRKFVSDAVEKAVQEHYQSIAFPAIGCGQLGYSITVVAQALIEEAKNKSKIHGISVVFVIQSNKKDVFNEFEKQLNGTQQSAPAKTISIAVNKGTIMVEKGDITSQNVCAQFFLIDSYFNVL